MGGLFAFGSVEGGPSRGPPSSRPPPARGRRDASHPIGASAARSDRMMPRWLLPAASIWCNAEHGPTQGPHAGCPRPGAAAGALREPVRARPSRAGRLPGGAAPRGLRRPSRRRATHGAALRRLPGARAPAVLLRPAARRRLPAPWGNDGQRPGSESPGPGGGRQLHGDGPGRLLGRLPETYALPAEKLRISPEQERPRHWLLSSAASRRCLPTLPPAPWLGAAPVSPEARRRGPHWAGPGRFDLAVSSVVGRAWTSPGVSGRDQRCRWFEASSSGAGSGRGGVDRPGHDRAQRADHPAQRRRRFGEQRLPAPVDVDGREDDLASTLVDEAHRPHVEGQRATPAERVQPPSRTRDSRRRRRHRLPGPPWPPG